MFIVLYADDILLRAPSVCMLEKLVRICEHYLDQIDIVINVKNRAVCALAQEMIFLCAAIRTSNRVAIPWVNELRYLGVFIVQSTNFKCSLTNAKRSFYRSANAIFGKVGHIAPEEATLQLICSKCVPVLIYGLEACPLLKSDLSSLDFIINCFFIKLFRTSSIDVVEQCQYYFNFPLPSVRLAKHVKKFEDKLSACNNLLCKINIR